MKHTDQKILSIICDLVKKYVSEYNNQPFLGGGVGKCRNAFDINNGLCSEFAEDLVKLLGGENDQQYILSDDMFLCDSYDEAIELWGKEDLVKTKNGAAWSKKMLSLYSIPPDKDITLFEYLPQHVWLYIDLKHYDAESPLGVSNPWELLIFKKYLVNLNHNKRI